MEGMEGKEDCVLEQAMLQTVMKLHLAENTHCRDAFGVGRHSIGSSFKSVGIQGLDNSSLILLDGIVEHSASKVYPN